MLATMTMHVDQLDVPIATVRRLIAEQFSRWTHLPVEAVASSGTVNALFRVGDHLTARFPLQLIEVAAARDVRPGRPRWRPAHARRLDAGVLRPQRAPRRRPPAPAALGRSSRTPPDQSGRDDPR